MSSTLAFLSRKEAATAPARRSPVWLLPILVLAGFAVLFFSLFQDRLLPAVEVKVATVLATTELDSQSEASASVEGSSVLLFQASGWVEPEPFPVKAASLIDGVVSAVHVLEGETVEKGAPIANLVDDDAKLRLAAAEAKLRMLGAERNSHVSGVAAGNSKRDSIKAEIVAAETLESEAKDQIKRFEGLRGSGAVSESDVIAARLRAQREQANAAVAKARLDEQLSEILRLEAAIATKDEEIALARVAVTQEKLNLDRTTILAPISGRILRLAAAPGEKKMLQMDHADSSTIAVLYDPAQLQVRVDVPLADAARLKVGQRAKVHCSVLPDQPFEGEVTRILGEADLQRNTLQAKVRILSPSDVLRPEMLCRVEFFGSAMNSDRNTAGDKGSLSLWIPAESLSNNAAWVFDGDTSRVSKREIKPSTDYRENYVRIQEGLRPGEKVVLAPFNLREGQRVKPFFVQP